MKKYRAIIRIKCPGCGNSRTLTYDVRDGTIPTQPRVCNSCGELMVSPDAIPKIPKQLKPKQIRPKRVRSTIRELRAPVIRPSTPRTKENLIRKVVEGARKIGRVPHTKPVPVLRPSMILDNDQVNPEIVEKYEKKRATCDDVFTVHDELLKNDPNRLSVEFMRGLISGEV